MSDWRLFKASDDYIEAIKATDSIEQPAVGFANPTEVKKDSVAAIGLLIKQNNTIIRLLLSLSERVRSLEEKQSLKTEPIEKSISLLQNKIQNLSLGSLKTYNGPLGLVVIDFETAKMVRVPPSIRWRVVILI